MKLKLYLQKCFEQMKRQAIEWRKYWQITDLTKAFYADYVKNLQNSREKIFFKGKKTKKNFKIGKRSVWTFH